MRKMKNRLDERQEQKLLQIEHNGCWFAFWALLVSLFIQQMIFGIGEWKYVAGEWIVFMCLALYICIGCMKNGIWDRKLEPNAKTNLLVSLVAAVVFGFIFSAVNYMNFHALVAAFWTFVIMAVILFVVLYSTLSICVVMLKKRVRKIEGDYEEE